MLLRVQHPAHVDIAVLWNEIAARVRHVFFGLEREFAVAAFAGTGEGVAVGVAGFTQEIDGNGLYRAAGRFARAVAFGLVGLAVLQIVDDDLAGVVVGEHDLVLGRFAAGAQQGNSGEGGNDSGHGKLLCAIVRRPPFNTR